MTEEVATTAKRQPLPDLADIMFLLLLQLTLYLKPDFIFSDGSTGWHLYAGDWILNNHQIPHHDLFSHTFPDKAWVAYEWLSDLLMASLVRLGGFNLLAVTVCSCISLLFFLLYQQCRKSGAHFMFAIVLCVIGAIVSAVHWLARPHLFTFFGVYLYSTTLNDYWRGTISSKRMFAVLGLTMLVWVNCHPAFLFGFAILAVYFGCAVIQWIFMRTDADNSVQKHLKDLLIAIGLVFTATLFNPYFLNLYVYIAQYLKGSIVLAATDEFLSPIFHGTLQPVCLEILFFLFAAGLAITRAPLTMPAFLLCLAFGHLSLSAVRNMPLFAIVVVPAIAQLFSKTVLDPSPEEKNEDGQSDKASIYASLNQLTKDVLFKIRSVNEGFTENERLCNMHILPWAAAITLSIAALCGGKLAGQELVAATFDHEHKPTKTLDAIASSHLDPNRGFNYDNWGGYLLYKTGHRVFIDDRADFYGEAFYSDYGTVSQVSPGWKELLDKYKIQWVLFPKNSRLAAALKETRGWKLVAEDSAAYLYARQD
jgi:hypothetical protein